MSNLNALLAEQQYINSMLDAINAGVSGQEETVSQRLAMNRRSHMAADDEAHTSKSKPDELQNLYQLIAAEGIKLAVPVTRIVRVEPSLAVTIVDNVLKTQCGDYRIVNASSLVNSQSRMERIEYYLLIENYGFAIACSELLGMETLNNDQLCRRGKRSKRIWLAATASQKSIAVLDLDGLAKMLEISDQEHKS